MKRFKTRDELRETGWTFEKNTDGNFIFVHPNSIFTISVDMLKELSGLPEETCKSDYGYEYDENMFITPEETPMVRQSEILAKILTAEDYRTYLKAIAIEDVYNEDFLHAREILDELLT